MSGGERAPFSSQVEAPRVDARRGRVAVAAPCELGLHPIPPGPTTTAQDGRTATGEESSPATPIKGSRALPSANEVSMSLPARPKDSIAGVNVDARRLRTSVAPPARLLLRLSLLRPAAPAVVAGVVGASGGEVAVVPALCTGARAAAVVTSAAAPRCDDARAGTTIEPQALHTPAASGAEGLATDAAADDEAAVAFRGGAVEPLPRRFFLTRR